MGRSGLLIVALGMIVLGTAGCSDDLSEPEPKTYTVGGIVSGLDVPGLSLRNGNDFIGISTNGRFVFPTELDNGASYDVRVFAQPNGQTCAVTGGTGRIQGADVSNIQVACEDIPGVPTEFRVGGFCDCDLSPDNPLEISNNASDLLILTGGGDFAFAEKVATGAAYFVEIVAQPSGQGCTVFSGSGTVGGSDVTSVRITCR